MGSRNEGSWKVAPQMPKTHFVSGEVYHDESIFAEEREKIFEKIWSLACHESEVAQSFDFRTMELAGSPLIVVRGEDGRIRTFLNVCSHRGGKLLTARSGNARAFTCFYHRWTYDTKGSCISIPSKAGYESCGLRAEDYGLREFRTDVKLGLVFISFDDKGGSLNDYLGDALEPLAEVLGKEQLEVFHYQRSEIDANWKAWMETNLDSYHTPMHYLLRRTQVESHRRIRISPGGHAGTSGMRAKYSNYGGWQNREDSMALPGIAADEARAVHIFPNASVIARGTVVRLDTVSPISPHRTVVECRGLGLKRDTDDERRKRMDQHNQYWGPLGRNLPEDALAAELCEMSFGSGSAQYQIIAREEGLTGQDDGMLRAYYEQWSKMMCRDSSSPFNRT